VIALEVIEHVTDEDKFVTEGLRVLRRGGKLIFTKPNRLRLTALARYLIGRPIRFPHTYASYGDLTEFAVTNRSSLALTSRESRWAYPPGS
jgi:2-polyprenyl-3-methyl-5-hydroxy-6-metoxy-1,4-benzoquinol methylase